jgi:NNP family nitrate/nitrite transporter-like MFS transporter
MSMGTLFGILPYVDGPNTGTIAGIVGAGGNVGAVFFLNIFRSRGDTVAFHVMATYCILAALLTPVIVIKGYQGIIFGKDSKQAPAALIVSMDGGQGGFIPLRQPTSKGAV